MHVWPTKTELAVLAFLIAFATGHSCGGSLKPGDTFQRLDQFQLDQHGKVRHIHRGFREDETPKQYEQEITTLLRSFEPRP